MERETADLEADVSEAKQKVGQLTSLLEVATALDRAAGDITGAPRR